MNNKNHDVWNALIMVFQFGINMLVPIFICTLFGAWLGTKVGVDWLSVPFFFVGALAGGNNIYKMSKKMIDSGNGDKKHAKKTK